MKIKEAAAESGVTARNIHYYIKEALLSPACLENGYYDFSEEDVRRLKLIHAYRNAQLPVTTIRSILNKPVTASYYLNRQLTRLKTEQRSLQQITESIDRIRTRLPIHPDFDCLYELTEQAGIPEPMDPDQQAVYDNTIVCRLQWSAFLPDTLTEYQEFLWAKINRLTRTEHAEDYRLLYCFLCGQDQKFIDEIYAARSVYYDEVARLTDEGCAEYALLMRQQVTALLSQPVKIAEWKKNYSSYYAPSVRVDDSGISRLVAEMSPYFAAYQKNINAACRLFYEWLHSPEGAPMLARMEKLLSPCLDIDCCHYGQLAGLATLGA